MPAARWLALGFAAALLAPAAWGNALGRDDEPVILAAAAVPSLLGAPPARVVAFRYEAGWNPIPVQVDERTLVDFGTIYDSTPMSTSILAYADAGTFTGADPDPALDADDEIALRARDAGIRAPSIAPPAHTVAGSQVEISITNPIDGSVAWVYLFRSDGTLDPAAGVAPIAYAFNLLSGDYKTTYAIDPGPNPESSTVTTASYTVHFSDRWVRDGTTIKAGTATGADILDRHKSLFGPGQCGRSEDTASAAEGAFIVNRSGPVRAIRGYVGANSGVTTHRIHKFYAAEEEIFTALRVHSLPGIMDYFDYAPAAAGMTYRNDLNTLGVLIDGSPDLVTPGPIAWEMVTGPQGTLVSSLLFDTDMPGIAVTSYYSDTRNPPEIQCTGDAFEYGASGFWRQGIIPNTDPTLGAAGRFELTRVLRYAAPNQTLAFAQRKALEAQRPLVASASDLCPDLDGDGYAVCGASCVPAPGTTCGDCDDASASVHPGAAEICGNGADDDCDGTDLGCGPEVCPDADGDAYAACGPTCALAPGESCGDCDNADAAIHPGALDACGDRVDQDCGGGIDVLRCERIDTGGDGRVDGIDLAVLGRAFGQCSPSPADFNGDGCVDGVDLSQLAAAWACVPGEDVCRRE